MRPEKAKQIINLAFKRFSRDKTILHFCNRRAIKAINKMIKKNAVEEKKLTKFESQEMYLDIVSDYEIYSTLHHISDRWNCTGRLKFMRRVISGVQS